MSSLKFVLIAGFAMFSMFFGSANLVFPLLLGYKTQANYSFAIVGWLLTAALVPFIGLLGMVKAEGNHNLYFSNLGKIISFLLIALIMVLLGPLGVVPRCITVSFGGFSLMYPSMPLWVFSGIFCLLTVVLAWKRNSIVEIIGLVLTPFKLGSIVFLLVIGIWFSPDPQASNIIPKDSLILGVKLGYQTMDLIAAFFFACTIVEYLRKNIKDHKKIFKLGIWSSVVGGSLLSIVYLGFVALGGRYSHMLPGVAPESLFAAISEKALGYYYALPAVSFTVAISCLATASILTTLWVDFLQNDILKNRISRNFLIIISILITFAVSLLGFSSIASFLGIILDWVYPLLIVYAVYKVLEHERPATN